MCLREGFKLHTQASKQTNKHNYLGNLCMSLMLVKENQQQQQQQENGEMIFLHAYTISKI